MTTTPTFASLLTLSMFGALVGSPALAQDGTAPAAAPEAAAASTDDDGTEESAADNGASDDSASDDSASDDSASEDSASEDTAAPPEEGDSVFMPAAAPDPDASSMPTLEFPGSDVTGDGEAAAPEAPKAERVTFLVTEVEVSGQVGLAPEDARDLLANRFGRLQEKVEVRSMGDIKTTLDKAALMAALGGDDSELQSLTGMLDVDRVVYGRIARIGTVIDVSVRVVNVRDANVEMAMSRRLKAGTDPSLTIAVLDRQADKLLAWVLETYTDGGPSDEFLALKEKKLKPRKAKDGAEGPEVEEAEPPAVEPPAEDSMDFSFTWLGIVGGVVAGSGLGIIAAAGIAGIAGSFLSLNASTLPYLTEGTVALGGAVLLGLGIGIIVADHYIFE